MSSLQLKVARYKTRSLPDFEYAFIQKADRLCLFLFQNYVYKTLKIKQIVIYQYFKYKNKNRHCFTFLQIQFKITAINWLVFDLIATRTL